MMIMKPLAPVNTDQLQQRKTAATAYHRRASAENAT